MTEEPFDQHPEIVGSWLTFENLDADGWEWLRLDQITHMATSDIDPSWIDVTARDLTGIDATLADQNPHDESQEWWRICTADPQSIARQIALARSENP